MLEEERKFAVEGGFEVPDLSGCLPPGGRVVPRPPMTLRATYYDTPDLRLARAGVSLRYRRGEAPAGRRKATGTFYKTLKELTEAARNGANLASLDQLFGTGVDKSDELTPDAYGWFLKRALGVETVGRSFADDFDIDTACP